VKKKRAFTLIELLVVVAIIALLISILLPSLSRARELSKRTVCSANLRGIGQAMYIYAQDDPQIFPAIFQDTQAQSSNMYLFNNNLHRSNIPSTTGIPSPTADLWSIVRANNTTPKQFICPSTTDVPDPATDCTAYYDFLSISNLSYGYQFQHSPNRRPIGTSSEPTFPIMADANPYVKGGVPYNSVGPDRTSQFRGNSVNHTNREGENILFQDGHVVFEKGPDVGLSGNRTNTQLTMSRFRDHCYTYHASTAGAPVDYGVQGPSWNAGSPTSPGTILLGGKSDCCMAP